MRRFTATGGALAASFLLTACPDPVGKLDTFNERRGPAVTVTEFEGCTTTGPEMAAGQYILPLKTDLGRAVPFLVTLDIADDQATFTLQPLDASDRTTEVGEAATYGPVTVESGTFTLELDPFAVPGEANPITGNPLEGSATLLGGICEDGLICGTFTGDVVVPTELPINGTFTLARNDDGTFPEPPPIDCDGTPAEPLP